MYIKTNKLIIIEISEKYDITLAYLNFNIK